MHIALDARDALRDRRGIGRFVRSVAREIAARPDCRLTALVRRPALLRARAFRHAIAPQVEVASAVPRGADVLWNPWNGTFFRSGLPMVATIHDCVPFAFPAPNARRRRREQEPIARSARCSRLVMVPSAFSSSEIRRYLGVASERLRVVPLAADPAFCPGPADALPRGLIARQYGMYVGTPEPHKNRGTLLRAHRRAFPVGDVPFVNVGEPVGRELSGDERPPVIDFECVDDAVLATLYRGAGYVGVPSLYEGFGLPALEAMASGAPVVAARAGALPEVCGEAAIFVEQPEDVEAWSAALRTAVFDRTVRSALVTRGRSRASLFSWGKTANAIVDVLSEACR